MNTMNATNLPDLFPVYSHSEDPENPGVYWLNLEIPIDPSNGYYTYENLQKLPKVLKYDGRVYVRTGWNSDVGRAYYRTGLPVARSA